ncbi:MAG: hypothetical protein TREMPRED_001376 [Tremellales sp. Tagirdzhanova-0007]|nr:MAG: hypothetical protein TREMPRED_001376 [Tremellales sp. Tagirdzhanova-0007]
MSRPDDSEFGSRPLFGGTISLDLPTDYIDASDLRQIPDNQEVFISSRTETSLVVEVLSMVEDGLASTDLWEALKFHFHSIAHDNASLNSTILTPNPTQPIPSFPSETFTTPSPITLTGTQSIHKFSHDPSGAPRDGHEDDSPDTVWMAVALWRCWHEGTEHGRRKKADLVLGINVNLSAEGGDEERKDVEEWWMKMVGSLRILDWGLFGDAS